MGREIRRVPANWRHPLYESPYHGLTFKPLLNMNFADHLKEWQDGKAQWDAQTHPNFTTDYSWEDYFGEAPSAETFVPYDPGAEQPWYQMYETVSEGTPCTPAFADPEDLIYYLSAFGEFQGSLYLPERWTPERARVFVKQERWFPTLAVKDGVAYTAKDGMPE